MNTDVAKIPKMESLEFLSAEDKTSDINGKEKIKFAGHLKYFIEGLIDDEDKQQEILNKAVKQFVGTDIQNAKESCKVCYGRGFTGYNSTFEYFTVCGRCFKPSK